MGFLVSNDERSYIGKHSMMQRQQDTVWQMVLLEIQSDKIDPFYSHPVFQDDQVVGMVTSGAYGHRCQKTLALAYINKPLDRNPLSVSILGRPYAAAILKRAPFDPSNSKLIS